MPTTNKTMGAVQEVADVGVVPQLPIHQLVKNINLFQVELLIRHLVEIIRKLSTNELTFWSQGREKKSMSGRKGTIFLCLAGAHQVDLSLVLHISIINV